MMVSRSVVKEIRELVFNGSRVLVLKDWNVVEVGWH